MNKCLDRTHREVIDDICECNGYCILKEVVLRLGPDDRTLEQLKCLERFKYERSKMFGREINWSEATKMWSDEGFAEKFSEIYVQGLTNSVLYNIVMGREK